jgi:hypothetical protein
MPTVTVDETQLYHEVRGSGPPVLLIMGATGDGGTSTRWPTCWPRSSRS